MNEEKEIQIIGTPDNSVPKFATHVNFNQLPNGDIVMSFMFKPSPASPFALIETILVDSQHASQIATKLNSYVNKTTSKPNV